MTIAFDQVSYSYGQVIGLLQTTLTVGPGVTGLLGPNGAGKSTLMHLAVGQLRPLHGQVTLNGKSPTSDPGVFQSVGLSPEQDAFYDEMTGREFLTFLGQFHGLDRATLTERIARWATFFLEPVLDRPMATLSLGQRQKIKLMQSLLHDPHILIWDEPMTGLDPAMRSRLVEFLAERRTGSQTILISSHILHELEQCTSHLIVMHQSRMVAYGTQAAIIEAMDRRPHRIEVCARDLRHLAQALVQLTHVSSVQVHERSLHVDTTDPPQTYGALNQWGRSQRDATLTFRPVNQDLVSLFKDLVQP